MTVACAHQPNFLPWLGLFAKIFRADLCIWLDDVQYARRSWINRVRISSPQGGAVWLTAPIRAKGNYHAPISEIRLQSPEGWTGKHLETLRHVYGKAPHYSVVMDVLAPVYGNCPDRLVDFNLELLEAISGLMRRKARGVRAGSMTVEGSGSARLAALCQAVGANLYLAGDGADGYEIVEEYQRRGIDYCRLGFEHPVYPQVRGETFTPGLSILDALFNIGPDATRAHLTATGKAPD